MRILIVTDAWEPQMNGVVRTLSKTVEEARKLGHEVDVIGPSQGFKTMPLPTYPDIKIALRPKKEVRRRIEAFAPEAIHIATEGPLGLAARKICKKNNWPFTTSYHTKFPEYIKARIPFFPMRWTYRFVRKFHNSAKRVMVTTPSMAQFLGQKGFHNLASWTRGVDLNLFHPSKRHAPDDVYKDLPHPIWVNIGRVAVEKNIEAFLKLDLPGSKVVVGDGPQLNALKKTYPDIHFLGAKHAEELARHFADADVFVFPSLTDTFGLVNIESMACGTPVAAFPVSGPIDIIPGSNAGACDEDLHAACMKALPLKREDARRHAETYSWETVALKFISYLHPFK